MPTFCAPDGTRLAYRVTGDGDPLLCVPGGPADSRYLGDLGGLSAHRRLIVPDPRGTGRSAIPDDRSSYRCDRLVGDVEALREHLRLPRVDLLGHSAGANVATQYAARYPRNVSRLALIGPSTRAIGIAVTAETRRELARLRSDEPWFPAAFAALDAIAAGTGADWEAIAPFLYGRWDAAAQEHHAAGRPGNAEAAALFAAEGAFDPRATRAALAGFEAPVLLLTGEFDMNSPPRPTAAFAALFPDATLVVQPGAGHYPWLDHPGPFVATTAAFLGSRPPDDRAAVIPATRTEVADAAWRGAERADTVPDGTAEF
ncbi:alpha/beta fold hydrolase [Streptomyces sp. SBT349]|uniref:alpha/beta fold hydrolase n=1 Tax=Streptomyces sp. SBT349 TaxID=1580539 RepID=UPI00099CC6EF|nr:alpha/beta hydrolase [Streptomyces sp. SBT349]